MSLVVVAHLLFACGCCCCWPERPLFGRRCCQNGGNGNGMECCGMTPGETIVSEGPVLDATPGPPGTVLNAPAPSVAPQLSPPPRLTPQPAQTMPYQPTKRAAS
jgi:hypothetical protein